MRFVKGVSARFRAVKGVAIIEPRIGTYGHIWTGLHRFPPVFFACELPYLAGSSNLLNFLNQSHNCTPAHALLKGSRRKQTLALQGGS